MYTVPFSARILVAQGDHVDKGQELTSGALNPHDVLRIRGIEDDEFGRQGVRNYLIQRYRRSTASRASISTTSISRSSCAR